MSETMNLPVFECVTCFRQFPVGVDCHICGPGPVREVPPHNVIRPRVSATTKYPINETVPDVCYVGPYIRVLGRPLAERIARLLTEEDAAKAREVAIPAPYFANSCHLCLGSGQDPARKGLFDCPACKGTGAAYLTATEAESR